MLEAIVAIMRQAEAKLPGLRQPGTHMRGSTRMGGDGDVETCEAFPLPGTLLNKLRYKEYCMMTATRLVMLASILLPSVVAHKVGR